MTIIEIFVLNLYMDVKFRNMYLAIFNNCSAIFINIRINFFTKCLLCDGHIKVIDHDVQYQLNNEYRSLAET